MPFIHSNVLGLTNLLESFRELCAGRFLQISTDEVYGSIPEGSWDETEPLSPNSPYSASKAGADLISLAFQKTYNLNLCITRCSNNYGPRQFPEKLIPLFITNLIDCKKLPLYGSGENVRDWIYVSDHCLDIEKVLTLGLEGEVYNVGGHYEISNLELTVEILRHFQGDKSLISYVPDRLGHDFRYSVDDKKIRKNLDFENYVSFEEGLTKTVEWYKNHPAWWRKLK
jgi:dTDP-glucose 4,6-dehydratase